MSGTLEPPASAPTDIRPVVGAAAGNRGLWLFAIAALFGGTVLFAELESHRATLQEPSIAVTQADMGSGTITPPPELTIPPQYPPNYGQTAFAPTAALAPVPLVSLRQQPSGREAVGRAPLPLPVNVIPLHDQQIGGTNTGAMGPQAPGPQVVFDAGRTPRTTGGGDGTVGKGDSGKGDDRVMATRFANPGTTIPKGTVMQAVLETALDSSRAGFARAIISRDIYGFDGSRVLVPKGSRLIGEYKADVTTGQSRALIQWQRLMRPDGVIINLDSPSADPLGRAGVNGKVNSHFFARFSGAFLQSAIQVGSQVAVNKLSDGTAIYAAPGLIALPGTLQGSVSGTGSATPATVQPTLTVKQGTSVSVFVAKDLDFTNVE